MTTPFPIPAILRHWLADLIEVFSPRTRDHVLTLVAGAILAPGCRTVATALRVMGLGHARCCQAYHRVLNRAVWSSLEGAHSLLRLLVHQAGNGVQTVEQKMRPYPGL